MQMGIWGIAGVLCRKGERTVGRERKAGLSPVYWHGSVSKDCGFTVLPPEAWSASDGCGWSKETWSKSADAEWIGSASTSLISRKGRYPKRVREIGKLKHICHGRPTHWCQRTDPPLRGRSLWGKSSILDQLCVLFSLGPKLCWELRSKLPWDQHPAGILG